MWEIKRYNPDHKMIWDAFVDKSRNATFLFFRDYMDYHSDRFTDHSLLAFRKGKLSAILPANEISETLYSHQGLTYGGWLWLEKGLDTNDIFLLWGAWLDYCNKTGLRRIVYKPIPYIYTLMPSQEDIYMLFLSGAKLNVTEISSAIDIKNNPGFNKLQRRHLRSLRDTYKVRLICRGDIKSLKDFHALLTDCLSSRHDVRPVHTLKELTLLMDRFPQNIKTWALYAEGVIKAGICGYITPICLHCQYIATSEEGRSDNVMARVVSSLVDYCVDNGIRYLDFGISNEDGGRLLNAGLNRQKTSFGASGVVYQRFEVNVDVALALWPTSLWPRQ